MSSNGGEAIATIEVAVVESQTVLREALVAMLSRQPSVHVTGQAGGLLELESLVLEPRVVVTALDLPEVRGPAVVQAINRIVPAASILVLTAVHHPAIVLQVLAAGATGYLLTSASGAEFQTAITTVASKEAYLQPELRAAVDRWRSPADGEPTATRWLSTKETDVLRLLAVGHTNAEIAALSGVSLRTVETHRARIFHKLGLQSRAQLVRYAFDEGLVSTR
jgi:two-component system response regulator NreC